MIRIAASVLELGAIAAALLVFVIVAAAPAMAATVESPPALEPQLDFSGVDAFWEIAATLQRDEQPADAQWKALLGSPGYRALTISEFQPEFFREAFTLALMPSRATDRAAVDDRRLAAVVQHVQRVSELKPQLRAWAEELRGTGMAEIIQRVFELVPESWRGESPVIAFVIFDFDARGYDPIVVDLLASRELELGPFLAHESHHWLRNRHLAFDPALAGPEDEPLLWVLNQLQQEGIADRIDKTRVLSGETETPDARAGYFDRYRENVDLAPDHLRGLDALLREIAGGAPLPDGFADSLRSSIPQSGHPTGYFMAERIVDVHGLDRLVESAGDPFTFVELYQQAALADPTLAPPFSESGLAVIRALGERLEPAGEPTLDDLVDAADRAFLLATLDRIAPPERIQELLDYAERQHQRGGGFHGLLPDPLEGIEALPVPADERSTLDAALVLARRRADNKAALEKVLSTFPFEFRGDTIPDLGAAPPEGWSLTLDHSAISGFVDARTDGEITPGEAQALASLPSNREMLQHRRNLGYVPDPLPTEEDLAAMIARAGSTDPLDQLWSWLHPWNFFGYADVATEAEGYAAFIAELRTNGNLLTDSALARIAAHAPEQIRYEGSFALTIGCLIRGWVTPAMPGLNVDQAKDDWEFLHRVMVHETYHKLQPAICPTLSGKAAVDFEELATADLGDPRQEKLYQILAYTVLEGTANYAAGPDGKVESPDHARAGSELLAEFVRRVVDGGELDAAQELIVSGLRNNGPLYAIGYQLSARIADEEGPRAVGEWLARGPVGFVLHAETLTGAGAGWLTVETLEAVKRLQETIKPPIHDSRPGADR